MRYLVTRSALSSMSDGVILDENGRRVLHMASAPGARLAGGQATRDIVMTDEQARTLAAMWEGRVEEDTAQLYHDDVLVAEVRRVVPHSPSQRFNVQFPNGELLVAQGDFTQRHYTIRRGARNVAQVSQAPETQPEGETLYAVNIGPGIDSNLILACVTIIDMLANPFVNPSDDTDLGATPS